MAKFIYRMQNILDIKYKLETQAKSEYAEANERLRQEELRLEGIYADINTYEDEVRKMNSAMERFDVLKLQWCSEAIEIKKLEIKQQLKVIEKAKKEVELARTKLSEVMVDRKTHEKLREKSFDEFKLELAGEEKKEIDELVSYKFNLAE